MDNKELVNQLEDMDDEEEIQNLLEKAYNDSKTMKVSRNVAYKLYMMTREQTDEAPDMDEVIKILERPINTGEDEVEHK